MTREEIVKSEWFKSEIVRAFSVGVLAHTGDSDVSIDAAHEYFQNRYKNTEKTNDRKKSD